MNRSYKSSGSSRQVQRRTSLDCSNLAVRPMADRPYQSGRRMGHLVPYAGFPYASPPGAPRAPHLPRRPSTPRYHTAAVGGGPGETWCNTGATGVARATSCSTVPRWPPTPPRMPGGWPLEGDPMDCSLPQGSSASSQDPRCFDHIHNHLDNPARNTHPPVITRADSDQGERRWHG